MPRRIQPDPYALKVGERLRALRLERNLSLADLAAASDLSKGHLSSIEHGLAAITIQTIVRAAKGVGVSPMYLLMFAGDDERGHILELIRKLPSNEVTKLRRELSKAAKEAAKAAKPAKTPRAKS